MISNEELGLIQFGPRSMHRKFYGYDKTYVTHAPEETPDVDMKDDD